jgi:hypothetical protein
VSDDDIVGLLDALQHRPLPAASVGSEQWDHDDGIFVTSDQRGHCATVAISFQIEPGPLTDESAAAIEGLGEGYLATVRAAWGEPERVDVRPLLASGQPTPLAQLLAESGTTAARVWERDRHTVALAGFEVDKDGPAIVVATVIPRPDPAVP